GTLGIGLGGTGSTPTVNDAGDSDTGPNDLQNYPVFTTGSFQGASIVVSGSLSSKPNTTYRVEFFANPACDASGHGEGRTFLGTTELTTSGGGNAAFAGLSFPASGGPVITATASLKIGAATFTNTSDFSACLLVATFDIDG